MKFHELSIGQQFEFEGEMYAKSAPLIANHAQSGKQKFMPRYAVVRLAGETMPAAPVVKGGPIRAEVVISAFEVFYKSCLQALENLPVEKQDAAREEFERARKVFLDSLHYT